jgi:hypothetical protein
MIWRTMFRSKCAAPGEIAVPHSLAPDSQGRLFVAGLNNFRVVYGAVVLAQMLQKHVRR